MSFFLSLAVAQSHSVEAPDIFMQRTTDVVLSEIKMMSSHDLSKMYVIVDKHLLPIVDVEYMSRWVAGRKAWSSAKKEQKMLFQETLEQLMIQTYSSTLFMVKDKEMKYSRPPHIDFIKAKTIPVYCEIKQPGKESIQMIYQLRMFPEGWKIFDVLVEGVSMLKGLQSQYEQVIAQKGINGGIESMENKIHQQNEKSRT
jgi:phospholipid transport system substrate-binding protein